MKLLLLTAFLTAAQALPPNPLTTRQACASPKLRKSWTSATVAERLAYLEAAVCITKKPSRLGNANSTLHDDFSLTHALLSAPQQIHGVAAFLPWHRYFVQMYEQALHECGYTGTAMYWDWVADSSAPTQSAVWDPVTGFGGNGTGPDNNNGFAPRVTDGPFKDYSPLYRDRDVHPHGFSRNWVQGIPGDPDQMDLNAHRYNPASMALVFAETTYNGFRHELENGPHSAIHFGVGGDPVFFLHHTQVDRVWWQWQKDDPSGNRTSAYEGMRNLPDGTEVTATLDDPLPMGDLGPPAVVRDYMDVNSPNLCYTYEN
ncbi:hypothetical protein B0T16DRAFT_425987 [Cercophora newfieldiana]|uniref:Tyrosinase copper-binding domain-containing protein n=1 Tax=Cercophora newfieldiana TaxID=92897 RepID=A0AA40D2C1_9PEZI|nr:hypothetical protein B0T16DRAFT_425987 [Cercophora newfieldiana]